MLISCLIQNACLFLEVFCSDLQGIRTNAKQDGDDWILNGSKVFITNGYMSDLVLVVAITNPQAKSAAHGISLFLVEDGMKGFIKGKKLHKIGMKAQVCYLHGIENRKKLFIKRDLFHYSLML